MLSRNCDGCSQMKACSKRYSKVGKGEKVYCPDGTAHLVDEDTVCHNPDIHEHFLEVF